MARWVSCSHLVDGIPHQGHCLSTRVFTSPQCHRGWRLQIWESTTLRPQPLHSLPTPLASHRNSSNSHPRSGETSKTRYVARKYEHARPLVTYASHGASCRMQKSYVSDIIIPTSCPGGILECISSHLGSLVPRFFTRWIVFLRYRDSLYAKFQVAVKMLRLPRKTNPDIRKKLEKEIILFI